MNVSASWCSSEQAKALLHDIPMAPTRRIMDLKLVESAERHWGALSGSALLPEVLEGVQFIEEVRKTAA